MSDNKEVDFYLLGLDIQISIHELHNLTNVIKEMDEVLTKDPSDENKLYMKETIKRYKDAVDKIKAQLEAYFQEELSAGKPTDFLFRRLYSKLKDAY